MGKDSRNEFNPTRIASWWCTIEDLLWSEKKIIEKIKRNAEAFANAKIDTAINFGFHVRFDFSNYFGQLHGYYANVCEELHRYNIKFMDHYSCNHVQRPKNEEEFRKLHQNHRHHILLFHDPVAAVHAQYEGHLFHDLCEIDLRDQSRGYSKAYQLEVFCHNNPEFLDMHQKYLKRLLKEVPMDGIQVDDMCDYAGLTTCGCHYCRERFRKEYHREIPSYEDKDFWGERTGKSEYQWGNYENPDFRNWLRMKSDSVADHLKLVKETVGALPLMTCCSNTGPMILNGLSLNLEKMSAHLDLLMLENCGIDIGSVNWIRMDAEALHQKSIAAGMGGVPAMAVSYSIYEPSGYLGWALARFWGVSNWSSTLNQRLEKDPEDAMEITEIIRKYNLFEVEYSNLERENSRDIAEVRLVTSKCCRENGWHDEHGKEHWDKIRNWSVSLVENNIGYRFVRAEELSEASLLLKEKTPLIMDGLGVVSLAQYGAIKDYLKSGGTAWVALPFGTHDEKGFKREVPLSDNLLKEKYDNLVIISSSTEGNPLEKLIKDNRCHPAICLLKGDKRWVVRAREHNNQVVLHLLNSGLKAIPHPTLVTGSKVPVLKDIESDINENQLLYEINTSIIKINELYLMSPELQSEKRKVKFTKKSEDIAIIRLDLTDISIYAVLMAVNEESND